MIFAERIHLTIPGIVCGVLLGTVYGWAGVLTAISSDRFIGQNLWFSSQGWNVPGSLSGPRCGRASLRSSRRVASRRASIASLLSSRRATQISPVRSATLDENRELMTTPACLASSEGRTRPTLSRRARSPLLTDRFRLTDSGLQGTRTQLACTLITRVGCLARLHNPGRR